MAEGKYLSEITEQDLAYLQNITDDVSSDNDEFFDFEIEVPDEPALQDTPAPSSRPESRADTAPSSASASLVQPDQMEPGADVNAKKLSTDASRSSLTSRYFEAAETLSPAPAIPALALSTQEATPEASGSAYQTPLPTATAESLRAKQQSKSSLHYSLSVDAKRDSLGSDSFLTPLPTTLPVPALLQSALDLGKDSPLLMQRSTSPSQASPPLVTGTSTVLPRSRDVSVSTDLPKPASSIASPSRRESGQLADVDAITRNSSQHSILLANPPPPLNNPSFKWPNFNFDKEKYNKSVISSTRSEISDVDESFELSLCGGLSSDTPLKEMQANFARHAVTFEQFCDSPDLTNNPNLVVRMNGRYFSWQARHFAIFHCECDVTTGDGPCAVSAGGVWTTLARSHLRFVLQCIVCL